MTDAARTAFFRHPFEPTLPDPGLHPDRVIVREIDFRVPGRRLEFYFSRGRTVDLAATGQTLQSVVDSVCDGTFQFPAQPPRLNRPYRSPLSLENDQLSYVVYLLNSGKDWQFARRGWPISIAVARTKNYYAAHRADASGHAGADDGSNFSRERDGCHVAFFIADGRLASSDEKYGDFINIHVDLVYRDTDETRFMPLIIDPDVRYPGGSEP